MAMGRPKSTVVLDSELREQLDSLVKSRSLPAGLVRRAKIILLSASGKNDREIAAQLETSRITVGLWRRRFLAGGVRTPASRKATDPSRQFRRRSDNGCYSECSQNSATKCEAL
jgi:hypothetical protein